MDVRCEHCKSEYEVEDANVSDLGTEVQCSDCGHQFLVKRLATPATPATPGDPANAGRESESEEAGAWVIETAAGRSLRLRDLTTLHKWIIERRVGREDRLSRGGDPWQRLGDMGELAPFFDIMDSAERARGMDTLPPALPPAPLAIPVLQPPVARPTQPSGPERGPLEPAPALSRPVAAPATPARAATRSLPSSLYDSGADETVIVRQEPAKPKILLKLIITMLVAAVVAYAGILWQNHRLRSAGIPSPGIIESPAPAVVPPAPAATEASEHAEVVEESAESGAASARGPVVEPLADVGSGEKVPLLGKAAKRAAVARPIVARKGKAQPPASAKAQGAQVSVAKQSAPQSLAAQGYVALNHRQASRAIALFKQALASNPTNGTALFGLAEAYRNAGQTAPALQSYRRYVELLPSGPDMGSARNQIRLLENKKR